MPCPACRRKCESKRRTADTRVITEGARDQADLALLWSIGVFPYTPGGRQTLRCAANTRTTTSSASSPCQPQRQFHGIELSLLDPDDEHDRSVLILAVHPEQHSGIESGRDNAPSDARDCRHQLLANEPQEMWHTARRMVDAGYERHEMLHMLASVVSADVYSALHENQPPEARTACCGAQTPSLTHYPDVREVAHPTLYRALGVT